MILIKAISLNMLLKMLLLNLTILNYLKNILMSVSKEEGFKTIKEIIDKWTSNY